MSLWLRCDCPAGTKCYCQECLSKRIDDAFREIDALRAELVRMREQRDAAREQCALHASDVADMKAQLTRMAAGK